MQQWLPVQDAYMRCVSAGKTEAMTESAKKNDKAAHAELNRIRAQPCNAECFDCTALKPGWAVLPHGVFICIDCAQLHRSMGRHISQTKAVNTGTYLWYPHELQVMRQVGNGRAQRALRGAPNKPSRDASVADREAYVRNKYEHRAWGPFYEAEDEVHTTTIAPPVSTPTAPSAISTVGKSAAKPKRAAGMAQARRLPQPEKPKEANFNDLIWLEDAPSTPATASRGLQAELATVASAEQPIPHEKAMSSWEAKKASVLSQFSRASWTASWTAQPPAKPAQPCPPNAVVFDDPSKFFSRYGL